MVIVFRINSLSPKLLHALIFLGRVKFKFLLQQGRAFFRMKPAIWISKQRSRNDQVLAGSLVMLLSPSVNEPGVYPVEDFLAKSFKVSQ